jgi:leucyl aminopeptidase
VQRNSTELIYAPAPMPSSHLLSLPPVTLHADLAQAARGGHDAVLVIGQAPLSRLREAGPLGEAIAQAEQADAALAGDRPALACVPAAGLPGGRLVLSTTGGVASWEQDVRLVAQAAGAAVTRAMSAGARRPLLWVVPRGNDPRFARALEVALLGALAALWEPLELRWAGERPPRLDALGVLAQGGDAQAAIDRALALERARVVARDICGTEPEAMAPEGIARYCEQVFAGGPVRVEVLRDQELIARGYPLVAAVARASAPVPRHHPRIVRLEYEGAGPIERTLLLAGKGLTYDTGGADLKTDGHMAGMSRDKGGAAAVAGLLQVCAERLPKGVRVIALLGAVRNSIGAESFVADEIIPSRAGVRVRIGNTDAEGRLVLADLLAQLREEADAAPSPLLFSIATLTGHAALAHGPYTALVETGAARQAGVCDAIARAGDALGDPVESSRLRPEDYAFVGGRSPAEDVISCNSLPSSRTPRGHQFPAAFLDIVSGLRAYNRDREAPVGFVHVDIAGSAVANGSWASGQPTGAPVIAMAEGLGLLS